MNQFKDIAPAFLGYLRMVDDQSAKYHLFDCMAQGPVNNEAWKLWVSFNGGERIKQHEFEAKLDALIAAVKAA